MTTRRQLPWSTPAVIVEDIQRRIPTGTVLSAEEARELFGQTWDAEASYVVATDGRAYRVVTLDDACRNGLTHTFSPERCANGHVAPRKLRPEPRGPECLECIRARKRRSRRAA